MDSTQLRKQQTFARSLLGQFRQRAWREHNRSAVAFLDLYIMRRSVARKLA